MYHIILTQSNTFLIGDIAKLLGIIMNGLFEFISSLGIETGAIGLSIILFTFVVKTLMFPMTIKTAEVLKDLGCYEPRNPGNSGKI